MKRRPSLFLVSLGVVVAVAVLAANRLKPEGKLLLLEWAGKSSLDTPPAAVLIEMGVKDTDPTKWDGRGTTSKRITPAELVTMAASGCGLNSCTPSGDNG